MSSLTDLAEQAQQGDGPSFYLLLEKAYYGEPGAFEAFHSVAMSHPSHFYRLAQFFSHPTLSEVVFKIIERPDFDLTPLKDWVATQPPLLMILGGLALERNHAGALKLLPQLEFDPTVYQTVVTEDYQYTAFLCLIADKGFSNVQDLLVQLVRGATQELFFTFVGVASEGSDSALHAINDGATLAHLTALPAFVRQYENQPELVAPVMWVVRHFEFCPMELFNPDSQEALKESGIESILFEQEESQELDFPLRKASGD